LQSLITFIIYFHFSKTFFVDEFLAFTKAADTRETDANYNLIGNKVNSFPHFFFFPI